MLKGTTCFKYRHRHANGACSSKLGNASPNLCFGNYRNHQPSCTPLVSISDCIQLISQHPCHDSHEDKRRIGLDTWSVSPFSSSMISYPPDKGCLLLVQFQDTPTILLVQPDITTRLCLSASPQSFVHGVINQDEWCTGVCCCHRVIAPVELLPSGTFEELGELEQEAQSTRVQCWQAGLCLTPPLPHCDIE